MVGIGLPNVKALRRAEAKLKIAKIPHYSWTEPDELTIVNKVLTGEFTAITTASIRGEQRHALENYRLYRHTRSVEASTTPSKGGSTGSIPVGCTNGEGAEASA